MIEHPDGFNWYHLLETYVPTVVTIGLFMLASRQSAKKEMKARHEENQKKLDQLAIQNKYLPAHKHPEKTGTLSAEHIQYDPDLQIT